MTDIRKYNREKLFDFVKHDALLSLYKSDLMRQSHSEIAQTYNYLFGLDINSAKFVAPLLVVNKEKSESIFTQVAYDICNSLGVEYFTNADLVNKKDFNILIYSIKLDSPVALDKVKDLKSLTQNFVMLNLYNFDQASENTIEEVKKFLVKNPNNFFFGIESQKPVKGLEQLQAVELSDLSNRPRLK